MEKTIVVTGGSQGIGRAIILHFAANGFAVATCARTAKDLQVLEKEVLRLAPNQPHLFSVCDMRDKKQVLQFAKEVLALWTHIEIIVNNAGVFLPGQVINEEEGILEKLIETNLYSAYYFTRAFVPQLLKAKQGHVFNMCSIASLQAYPNGGSYSISKFALLGFSKALREEMKPHNIRVTSILPGATLTASWAGVDIPAARLMKAEDVAKAVFAVYSLSENTVVEDIVLRPILGDL